MAALLPGLLLASVAVASGQASSPRAVRPGGLGAARPADAHVQELCDGLRASAQQQLQASGWNGVFTDFTAVTCASQVVAGTNYFVKVRIGTDQFIHMRIYEPLPHTQAAPELSAVKMAEEKDTLDFFS
mmetsp:Transcript_2868/g.8882  ORF Transcript_2868/g.8882 Transcript_2868/m.8882 type:complete len:129 (+) Transcript_2868:1-387(+)